MDDEAPPQLPLLRQKTSQGTDHEYMWRHRREINTRKSFLNVYFNKTPPHWHVRADKRIMCVIMSTRRLFVDVMDRHKCMKETKKQIVLNSDANVLGAHMLMYVVFMYL